MPELTSAVVMDSLKKAVNIIKPWGDEGSVTEGEVVRHTSRFLNWLKDKNGKKEITKDSYFAEKTNNDSFYYRNLVAFG